MYRTVIQTPWRPLTVLSGRTHDGAPVVSAAWFGTDGPKAVEVTGCGADDQVSADITAWIEGDPNALDQYKVDVAGSTFHRTVWTAMRDIPAGATATYGQLAAAAGFPRAARAVGTACAVNQVALFIPCHRVVAANGLGGYGWDVGLKAALLEHEGVEVAALSRR